MGIHNSTQAMRVAVNSLVETKEAITERRAIERDVRRTIVAMIRTVDRVTPDGAAFRSAIRELAAELEDSAELPTMPRLHALPKTEDDAQ